MICKTSVPPLVRVFAIVCLACAAQALAAEELTVLTYHDIVVEPGEDYSAVSRSMFIAQMDYLEENGYQPISLKLLLKVYNKQASLPKKPVLLTFDDGLNSYYEFVVPILKIYGYPSVASVVSGWLDGKNVPPEYLNKLMTWEQLRELSKSDLVDLVSHTHDLHHFLPANVQGNSSAASVTRQYLPLSQTYESEDQFKQRIRADLSHSSARMEKEIGLKPYAIAWPYGYYDEVTRELATELGLTLQFSLDDGPTPQDQLPYLNRIMVLNDNELYPFIEALNYHYPSNRQRRFVYFSLDGFVGKSADEQNELLSKLLDQLEELNVNMVVTSPFTADTSKTFFSNDKLPVATDILNRVSHQIRVKLGINDIFVTIPSVIAVADQKSLFAEMARINWINGVIFQGQIMPAARDIKQTILQYRPRAKFGYTGIPEDATLFDFALVTVGEDKTNAQLRNTVLQSKGAPIPIYVLLQDNAENKANLKEKVETILSLGIRHYGFTTSDQALVLPHENTARNMAEIMLVGAGESQ